MTAETVIGVDLGTQSIKVIFYQPANRQVIACAQRPLSLDARHDGTREQDAEDWISAFEACLGDIDPTIKETAVALSVSGQQHGFVPLDKNGFVLAPVKLWCDTSTDEECSEILEKVGGEKACRQLTGNSVPAGFTASKILWLKKNKPDLYQELATILLPHDFMNFYLTGVRCMEFGDASGTGLLDVRTRGWQSSLLKAIDPDRNLEKCLPPLIHSTTPVGQLRANLAQRLNLPENLIVAAGGGDNMMAAIGTGNVCEGTLTASLGTSGTLFAYANKPITDEQGDLAAFCSSTGGWLPLLCTMNCTVATEQIRNLLDTSVQDLESLTAPIRAGSEGVITLPFYNGERTPNLPAATATIFGLDMTNTTAAHLLRSAMEAAVFGLKEGLSAFNRNGMQFDSVVLTGGGSTSATWRQIFANVFNLPVKVVEQEENAAFGAALQALWCLAHHRGNTSTIQDITQEHVRFSTDQFTEPDQNTVKVYEKHYERYRDLVKALTPIYQRSERIGP